MCPQFLRSRDCGQVDVAVLLKRRTEHYLKVVEAKSSVSCGTRQIRRLLDSVDFLAKILNVPGGLEQLRREDYLPKPRQVLKLKE
ncbi:MAG: hypothetical protein CME71_12925 [Halobacteriovorax sp.]|nr:hypothetical protein [Halobacteriovorax sp.]